MLVFTLLGIAIAPPALAATVTDSAASALRQLQMAGYRGYRLGAGALSLRRVRKHAVLSGHHVVVYYPVGDQRGAELVLEVAEAVYPEVAAAVGYSRSRPIPVVVHESKESLRATFGWRHGQVASGAYWAGVVHVVSPTGWLPGLSDTQRRVAYRRLAPLAHELTHLLLDYRTSGNYPRWFTEGLAQWVEYRLTGYLWRDAAGGLSQDLYAYEELTDRFDRLPNQALAYRQALGLIAFLAEDCRRLEGIIQGLARGVDFAREMQAECGMAPPQLFQRWLDAGRPAGAARLESGRAGVGSQVAERRR